MHPPQPPSTNTNVCLTVRPSVYQSKKPLKQPKYNHSASPSSSPSSTPTFITTFTFINTNTACCYKDLLKRSYSEDLQFHKCKGSCFIFIMYCFLVTQFMRLILSETFDLNLDLLCTMSISDVFIMSKTTEAPVNYNSPQARL